MTQALLRTHFNRSRLIRFVADLATVDGAESRQAFAQRLGQWVSFTDATTLYTALDSSTAQVAAKPSTYPAEAQSAACGAVTEELNRVRTATAELIQRACSPALGATRIKFPAPQPDAPLEIAFMYSPFHRFYLSLQREMEAKVAPLRAKVRDAMTTRSPALRQLATLDAALDQILNDRERRLFSTVPTLLEKRFAQLRISHQQKMANGAKADDPAAWMQPGAWLADFRDDLRGVLLAELDLRLQPAMGLMEALGNEVNGST